MAVRPGDALQLGHDSVVEAHDASGKAHRRLSLTLHGGRHLLRFLMQLMLVAARAVLLPLDALRMQPLVLGGEVIPILALATGEDDLVARHGADSRVIRALFAAELTIGIEPMTSPLPRVCSTN